MRFFTPLRYVQNDRHLQILEGACWRQSRQQAPSSKFQVKSLSF